MLKVKKIFSAFVGVTMAANVFMTMPFSAFADEESSRTYTYDGYEVSYDVTNSWGNTEIVSVTLSNTGDSAIENWMLYFDPNGQVHDTVNVQEMQTTAGITYFKNSGYNATVNPDSSVSFSYMVDDCEAIPDDFTLCQTRSAKESGYQVSLQVNQTWGDSFNGEIIIQNNTDQPIEAWELTVDTNFTITEITNSWAATVTELESYSYMMKGTYTGTVYANSSVSLGFNGMKSGDPVITDYSLTEVVADEEIIHNASDDKNYSFEDLEELNKDSDYPLEVETKNDGTVCSIDGKFSNILVTDEKSALNSLYGVKNLLGMTNPKSELIFDRIYESKIADYKSYFFNQIYNDIPVYGHSVTVVARSNGEVLSLDSNYINISEISTTPVWSENEVRSEYDVDNAELVIYILDAHENMPVLGYFCHTIEEDLLISAVDGTIIEKWDTITYDLLCDDQVHYEKITSTTGSAQIARDVNDNVIFFKSDNGTFNNISVTDNLSAIAAIPSLIDSITNAVPNIGILSTIRNNLDINNGYSFTVGQMVPSATVIKHGNTSTTADIYHLDLRYKGVKVYGRIITLTVSQSSGQVLLMDSNVVDVSALDTTIPSFSQTDAISAYPSSRYTLENNEPVIYTWRDSANSDGELVYVFDDLEDCKTLIVSATDTKNTILEENELGKGLNETDYLENVYVPRELKYFPIQKISEDSDGNHYWMALKTSNGVNIDMHTHVPETWWQTNNENRIKSPTPFFYYPEAVTSYFHALGSIEFYKTHFDFDVISNLRIIVNEYSTDHAGYTTGDGLIAIRARHDSVVNTYSTSGGTMCHEVQHNVFNQLGHTTGEMSIADGINESYANLFKNLYTNWRARYGLYMPTFKIIFSQTRWDDQENDISHLYGSGGHELSPYINYPAYNMHKKGLLVDQIFFESMMQGKISSESSLNSVRVNVIKAAKALNLSPSEIQVIRNAFDELKVKDAKKYKVTVNVTDPADSNENFDNLNLNITLKKNGTVIPIDAGVPTVIETGWYDITVKADGYLTYNYHFHMYPIDSTIPISLVKQSGHLPSTIDIVLKDIVSDTLINGNITLLNLTENTTEIFTSANGMITNLSLSPGYYAVIPEDSETIFVHSLIIVPGNGVNLPPYTYSDINMFLSNIETKRTDLFRFNLDISTEGEAMKDFKYSLGLEGNADNNARFAIVTTELTPTGVMPHIWYNTDSFEKEFSVGINISQKNFDLLPDTERNAALNFVVTIANPLDPDYEYTIVISGDDLAVGFNEIATLSFDENGIKTMIPNENLFFELTQKNNKAV